MERHQDKCLCTFECHWRINTLVSLPPAISFSHGQRPRGDLAHVSCRAKGPLWIPQRPLQYTVQFLIIDGTATSLSDIQDNADSQ